jgi:hypothetical protein
VTQVTQGQSHLAVQWLSTQYKPLKRTGIAVSQGPENKQRRLRKRAALATPTLCGRAGSSPKAVAGPTVAAIRRLRTPLVRVRSETTSARSWRQALAWIRNPENRSQEDRRSSWQPCGRRRCPTTVAPGALLIWLMGVGWASGRDMQRDHALDFTSPKDGTGWAPRLSRLVLEELERDRNAERRPSKAACTPRPPFFPRPSTDR